MKDVVDQFFQVVQDRLYACTGFFGAAAGGGSEVALRIDRNLTTQASDMRPVPDGVAGRFARAVEMLGGDILGLDFDIDKVVILDHFREQGLTERGLHLAAVNQGGVEGAAMLLVKGVDARRVPPVQHDQHRRHLILLCEGVYGIWNDPLLPVTVQEDLLAEARVPETGDHGADIVHEGIFGYDNRARHAHVMIGVRTVPQRLGDRTSGCAGDFLCHTRDEESVLAERFAGAVCLGRPDRDDNDVVFFATLNNLLLRHVLEVNAAGLVHIAAGWEVPLAGRHIDRSFRCWLYLSDSLVLIMAVPL